MKPIKKKHQFKLPSIEDRNFDDRKLFYNKDVLQGRKHCINRIAQLRAQGPGVLQLGDVADEAIRPQGGHADVRTMRAVRQNGSLVHDGSDFRAVGEVRTSNRKTEHAPHHEPEELQRSAFSFHRL